MSHIDSFLTRAKEINCSSYESRDLKDKLILIEEEGFGETIGFIKRMSEENFSWFVRRILLHPPNGTMLVKLCDRFHRRHQLVPAVIIGIGLRTSEVVGH